MRKELTPEQIERGDAVKILERRYGLDTPEARARVAAIRQNMDIGQQLYDLREAAGLTHEQLAALAGVTADDIESVEEADFEGNNFEVFWKAARALGKGLEVRVTEPAAEPQAAKPRELIAA